jgi:hypothetical protein
MGYTLVGAFCFRLFVYRFSNPVAGHRQSRRLLRYDSTPAPASLYVAGPNV